MAVQREVREEAGIDLREAASLFFAGIVTWGVIGQTPLKGMYTYIAHLSAQQAAQITSLHAQEGLITWKPLAWICDPNNTAVVNNIPRFLPPMLKAQTPFEYFYTYEIGDFSREIFRHLEIRALPAHIVLSECQGW